jgi:1-acyl-sn-glycerol-3-phosphate acyltransferase
MGRGLIQSVATGTMRVRVADRELSEEAIRWWQVSRLSAISFRYHVLRVVGTARDRQGGTKDQRAAQGLGRALIRYMGLEVEVLGAENLDGLSDYTVASNHASYIDWAFILGHFPVPPRFVAKAELRRVPVVGSYLAVRGIMIDRQAGEASQRRIRDAARADSPWPLLIFPEGTRSHDGRIKPFKRAGLRILAEADKPIVPLTLVGTYEVFAPRARTIDRGRTVRMVIGAPIDPREVGREEACQQVERAIRETFAAHRDEVRARSETPRQR